ncbi:MAG: hypothetical protein EXQ49_04910 [Acidobacteria bacterium]|nr:hypothetical protein [Acidobacteriota bacterium]
MSVNAYERVWMWGGAGGLIVLFLAAIGITAVTQAVQPPSHIETINPATLAGHPEFGDPQVKTTIVGIIFVILAYAYPLATLIMTPRFGSPPFQPF